MADDERVKQACAYLRLLLLRPGDYRNRWAAAGGPDVGDPDHPRAPVEPGTGAGAKSDPGQIDYAAVAAVLGVGGRPEPDPATVRDALTGARLDPAVLERFIAAFGFTPRQAHRLRDLMRGSPATRVITGAALRPADLYRRGSPGYETLALHEVHTLGPDGRPAEHQTIQVIRATADGLTSYPLRFDTDELTVEVARGGRVGDQVYRYGDGLYAVDILLDRPLARGESALMQYQTTFFYRSAPPPELRRGLARATRDVSIWVSFHPQRLPARVWSASWDRIDQAHILDRELVELDEQRSVHRRFDVVEGAIVGFYWEWS